MGEKKNNFFMVAIIICLLIIAFKEPEPYYVPVPDSNNFPVSIDTNGQNIVQLGENRIAIVDSSQYSGGRGDITVLEFNPEEKAFEVIGNYNYLNGKLR